MDPSVGVVNCSVPQGKTLRTSVFLVMLSDNEGSLTYAGSNGFRLVG